MKPSQTEYRTAEAAEWLARREDEEADKVRKAVNAVPAHMWTPRLLAAITACLVGKTNAFSREAKESAEGYLIDLHDDMQHFGAQT